MTKIRDEVGGVENAHLILFVFHTTFDDTSRTISPKIIKKKMLGMEVNWNEVKMIKKRNSSDSNLPSFSLFPFILYFLKMMITKEQNFNPYGQI